MECLKCSNQATPNVLIVGFDLNGNAKTTVINNRCWSCTNKINDFLKREYEEKMRDARNEAERRKKQRAEDEKTRKWNEHKSSHCYTCNTKSTLFHFIYDKKTNKVWESWSNATDPANQLVFCNKSCYQKWFDKENTTSCSKCYKTIKPGQTYWSNDASIKFCSQSCARKHLEDKEQAKIDEIKKKINNLNRQRLEALQELMEKGHDLGFDFENDDFLDEEVKNICRKYQAERKELKKIEEAKKYWDKLYADMKNRKDISHHNWETSDLINDETKELCRQYEKVLKGGDIPDNDSTGTCDECGQKGTKYNLRSANDGKEFCTQTCGIAYYNRLKDKPNTEKKCDQCSKKINQGDESFYADAENKTGSLCHSCWDKNYEEEKTEPCPSCHREVKVNDIKSHISKDPQCKIAGEAMIRILLDQERVDLTKLDLSNQAKIILTALIKIRLDNKWVDVDKLNIPSAHKKSLKGIMQELGITNDYSHSYKKPPHFLDTWPGLALCLAGWVLVPTGIFFLIRWMIRRRKNKKI